MDKHSDGNCQTLHFGVLATVVPTAARMQERHLFVEVHVVVAAGEQGSGADGQRQSDYDLVLGDRRVGTKSKRQLQREADERLGEESQEEDQP
jgi:hypothetical protein